MPAIIDYTTSQVDSDVSSITVTLPAEYAVGDLLLVFGSKDYSTGGALTCATSGWVEIQQANYLTSGMLTTRVALFAKEATSTSETPPVIASTNAATWTGLSISIRGWHDTGTLSDVISAVAGYSTTTYPFTASSITTLHDDCLVLYAMASSSVKASVPIADAGTMWITSIASAANALAAGYKYQHTAGEAGTAPFYTEANSFMSYAGITVAIRGNGTHTQPHYDAQCITVIDPLNASVATITNTTIGSTVVPTTLLGRGLIKNVGTITNGGCAPFDDTMKISAAVSESMHAFTKVISPTVRDISSGFVLGTYRFAVPKDGINIGRNDTAETGLVLVLANDSDNYNAYGIGGYGQKDMSYDGRSTYVVQTNQTVDTRLTSLGTFDKAQFDRLTFVAHAIRGAAGIEFSQFIHVPITGIPIVGGTAANPITSALLERDIGEGYALQMIEKGVAYVPLVFGGSKDVHVDLSLYSLSFPNLYNSQNCLAHVDPGAFGVTIRATATSSIKMPSGIFSAKEKWHFVIDADSSASATYDFSGRSIVNAIVTLRHVCTFSSMSFIECAGIVQNGSTITGCTFSGSSVTADNPGLISSSSFKSGGTGHAITITETGTYGLSGLAFTGYGADDSTDAAIYNNSGGAVTLNVSNGTAPTVRNGAGASTTVVAGATLTIGANVTLSGAEIRIYDLDNSPAGSLGTELSGTESHGSATYSYSGTPGNVIWLQIMKDGYEEYGIQLTFPETSSTFTATLALDRNI